MNEKKTNPMEIGAQNAGNPNGIMNIGGMDCYEENGVAYLRLETCARGLGFTDTKNGVEYVRWNTVTRYLSDFGFSQQVAKDAYIPENIFYRLAMKAKNAVAEKFQAKWPMKLFLPFAKPAHMSRDTQSQTMRLRNLSRLNRSSTAISRNLTA